MPSKFGGIPVEEPRQSKFGGIPLQESGMVQDEFNDPIEDADEAPMAAPTEAEFAEMQKDEYIPPEEPEGEGMIKGTYGVGEAVVGTGWNMTAGLAANALGSLKGIAKTMEEGTFGTQKGAEDAERYAQKFAQTFAFEPDTATGKAIMQGIGEIGAALEPLGPMAAEMQAAGGAAKLGRQARRTPLAKAFKDKATIDVKAKKPKIDISYTPEGKTKITPNEEMTRIGTLINKASKGNKKAREQLAKEININAEAKAAADRLDIDLSADILSDKEAIKQAAGLSRSEAGSAADISFREAIKRNVEKVDTAINSLGDASDLASVSDEVLSGLKTAQDKLKGISKEVYENIKTKIPARSKASVKNIRARISSIKKDMGGIEGLTAQEKKLVKMLEDPSVTYGRLDAERSSIGQALSGKSSPYADANTGRLKQLYAALKEDQVDNVTKIGGNELRDNLKWADGIVQKQKLLEESIVNVFGKDTGGSISSTLRQAITQGSKGDITKLNKTLKVIPKDLQKKAVLTSLIDTARSARAHEDIFGLAEYTKTFKGLKKNAPVYNKIVDVIADGGDKKAVNRLLTDLYVVSKRMQEAKSNVMVTGKANQALLKSMTAEGLIGKVFDSTLGRTGATVVGAKAGGGAGAMAARGAIDFLSAFKSDKVKSAGRMLSSQEFGNLAAEAATQPTIKTSTMNKFINSKAFNNWKKSAGVVIEDPRTWVMESVNLSKQQEEEQ